MDYQNQVANWAVEVFGEKIATDIPTRGYRFIEEAIELVQALGVTKAQVATVLDYVYGRPVGEPEQEVGGVMVTLAALCAAKGIDMELLGWTEQKRCMQPEVIEKIRNKQKNKPNPTDVLPATGKPERGSTYTHADGRRLQLVATDPDDGALYVFRHLDREDDDIMFYTACEASDLLEFGAVPRLTVQHTEDIKLDEFTKVLHEKLAKSRAKGRDGWQTMAVQALREEVLSHITKGDPIDVAIYCMMLWARGEPTVDTRDDLFYLQDSRSYVGNDMMWWMPEGNGYTSDLRKAAILSRDEAAKRVGLRGTDRMWPKAYIDTKARPAVDFQHVSHREAYVHRQNAFNRSIAVSLGEHNGGDYDMRSQATFRSVSSSVSSSKADSVPVKVLIKDEVLRSDLPYEHRRAIEDANLADASTQWEKGMYFDTPREKQMFRYGFGCGWSRREKVSLSGDLPITLEGPEPEAASYHLNSTGSVAVADDFYYDHDMTKAKRGAKYILLGRGGVAVMSHYDGDAFWVGFAPLPKSRKDFV